MTREELTRARSKAWRRLAELLRASDQARGARKLSPSELKELSELYRSLAGDVMRVQRDKLGADLEQHLHGLAARAHNTLYARSGVGNRFRLADLILDFPGALRRNGGFFLLACLLFFGSGALAGYAAYSDEAYALAVMSREQLEQMDQMHKSSSFGSPGAQTHAAMSGFYVQHNVSIAFQCFGTGLAFGLGSMFFLLFNGLSLGVVFGHLFRTGTGDKLLTFVAAHSPWELTAIAIAGAAGIQMGFALVSTRGRTRLGNLQAHGMEVLRQIVGAAAFLVIAAMVEGWVSPSGLDRSLKLGLGAVGWTLVTWIVIAWGRRRPVPDDAEALIVRPRGGDE